MVVHHFTIDVEEYYQVSAFETHIPRSRWGDFESRVVANMMELLGLLSERDVRATMFVLGCVAESHPTLIRELAAAGHEIASHGWDHRRITDQEPEEFRSSVRRTKGVLEDLTGVPVLGFRAPSFSLIPGREWALDILLEEGYRYDSSLFPVRRSGYGYPGGERDLHWLERSMGRLAEVPPATLRRLGTNIPAAGGGYLRLLPLWLIQSAFRDAERRGVPATFYIHPWEIDPDQPRLGAPWATRLRHYSGLKRAAGRVRSLLREFRFQPIAATLDALQVR